MNDQPITAEEQDDAAFRARLAPLASEVLPSPPIAERRRPRRRRTATVSAGIAAVVVVLGIAALQSKWPWSRAPGTARVVTDLPRPAPPTKSVARDMARIGVPSVPPASAQTSSDMMIGLLMRRGESALDDGDIIGARLLFERAAALGSAAAANDAGKTYDIEFLSRTGARGIRADQAVATAWFRKAAALGDPDAQARLARIEARPRP